jgi:hypothetical protein
VDEELSRVARLFLQAIFYCARTGDQYPCGGTDVVPGRRWMRPVEDGLLKASVGAPNGGTTLRNSTLCFDFDAIRKSNPEIYHHVMKVLARHLRDTNHYKRR